jgi:hypothetical protein
MRKIPTSWAFLLKAERNELKLKPLRSHSREDDKRKRERENFNRSARVELRSKALAQWVSLPLFLRHMANRKKTVRQVSWEILRLLVALPFAPFHLVKRNQGKLWNFYSLQEDCNFTNNPQNNIGLYFLPMVQTDLSQAYNLLVMGFEVDFFPGKVDFKVGDFPPNKSTKSRFEVEKVDFEKWNNHLHVTLAVMILGEKYCRFDIAL